MQILIAVLIIEGLDMSGGWYFLVGAIGMLKFAIGVLAAVTSE